jgi:hypothetical protein
VSIICGWWWCSCCEAAAVEVVGSHAGSSANLSMAALAFFMSQSTALLGRS